MDFKNKYLKYKKKYLELKLQLGGIIEEETLKVSSKIDGPISYKIEGPISYYYLTYNDKRFLMMGDIHSEVKNCYGESGMSVVNYIKNILKENKDKKCIDFFLETEYYGSFNLDERSEEFRLWAYSKKRIESNESGFTKHILALRDFFLVNHNQNNYFRFHETDIRQTLLDKIDSSFYRQYKGLLATPDYLENVPIQEWTDKQNAYFIAGYHPQIDKNKEMIKKGKQMIDISIEKRLEKMKFLYSILDKLDIAEESKKDKEIEELKIKKKELDKEINELDNEINELYDEIEEIEEEIKELNKNREKRISMTKKFLVNNLLAIMEYYIGNNELTKEEIKKILEILSPNDEITDDDIKDEIKMKYFITKQKIKCDPSVVNIIIKEIKESFIFEKNLLGIVSNHDIIHQFAVKMVDLYTLLRMFRIGDGSSRKRSIKGCSDNEFKNIIGYYGNHHTINIVSILIKIGAELIKSVENFVDGNFVDGKEKQCLDIGDFVPFTD